jgi:hypothetical protein
VDLALVYGYRPLNRSRAIASACRSPPAARPVIANGSADDDPNWREQLHALAESIHAWSGNHASLHELSPKQLRAAARRAEPVVDSLRDSSVTLAGADFSNLIGGRSSRALA